MGKATRPAGDTACAATCAGALRFWHRDARGITELIQLRAMDYYGLRSSSAVAGNRMLAAMACALAPPGRRTVIENAPEAIDAFLRLRPVRELPGIGTRTAATLAEYGLHTVGDVADVPQLTLQRLLGARVGRTLHERAHGRNTQLVDPTLAPASISAEHVFSRDELDPAEHRRALLALADDLGIRLRTSGQIAHGLTCTVRYADQSSTRRTRTLPEATFHTVLLARTAYGSGRRRPAAWPPDRAVPQGRGPHRRRPDGRADQPRRRPRNPPGGRSRRR
ncbi:DNA polymerase Y family protein [Streptomyces sp. NPDC054837]